VNRTTLGCGAALLMSALSVAACGSNAAPTAPTATASAATGATIAPATTTPPPQATAAPVDSSGASPCELVTEADATTLLGSDPGPGVVTTSGVATTCSYRELHVAVERGGGAKGLFEAAQSSDQSQPGFQTLSGVADGGFLFKIEGADWLIYILKGSSLVSMIAPNSRQITAATLTALGTTAAGRL
jgi:hypothetical protein